MCGVAIRAYSIPRATWDIDLTVTIPRDRLYELLEKCSCTIPAEYHTGWIDIVAGMPIIKIKKYLGSEALDIDLFLAESKYQLEMLSRRQRVDIAGESLWTVTPEDLILLKLLANRMRDQKDVDDLFFTQSPLDINYMRRWSEELGVDSRLEQALLKNPENQNG